MSDKQILKLIYIRLKTLIFNKHFNINYVKMFILKNSPQGVMNDELKLREIKSPYAGSFPYSPSCISALI